jgi:hypothetical protein
MRALSKLQRDPRLSVARYLQTTSVASCGFLSVAPPSGRKPYPFAHTESTSARANSLPTAVGPPTCRTSPANPKFACNRSLNPPEGAGRSRSPRIAAASRLGAAGKELFYFFQNGKLTAVDVRSTESTPGIPKLLFQLQQVSHAIGGTTDVRPFQLRCDRRGEAVPH